MSDLLDSLAALGRDTEARDLIIEALRRYEKDSLATGVDIRDAVTGPILDAICRDAPRLRKVLASGLEFEFVYRCKIQRDLLLTRQDEPDHVFEPFTTRLLLHLCKRGGNILIGGAYGGDHALLAAQAVKESGGTVFAFEPNLEQLTLLAENAALNHIDNIEAVQSALWSHHGARLRLVGHDAFAHPELIPEGELPAASDIVFDATSIEHFGSERHVKHLGAIMLDVEGGEEAILRGAAAYLSQPAATAPHVIFEVHRLYVDWSQGLEETSLLKLLRGHGYDHIFAIRDFQSNVSVGDQPIELVPLEAMYLDGPPHGFNMIAVKDAEILKDSSQIRVTPGVSPKLLLHKDPSLHHPTGWVSPSTK